MRNLQLTILMLLFSVPAANATISLAASGTSQKGVDIAFRAELTISGDELTEALINESPVNTLNPDDTLGSFYFDIVNGVGERPRLNYFSAVGDVYAVSKTSPDALVQASAGLMATSPGDGTWQFVTVDEMVNPHMAFGLGTVGNSGKKMPRIASPVQTRPTVISDKRRTVLLVFCILAFYHLKRLVGLKTLSKTFP